MIERIRTLLHIEDEEGVRTRLQERLTEVGLAPKLVIPLTSRAGVEAFLSGSPREGVDLIVVDDKLLKADTSRSLVSGQADFCVWQLRRIPAYQACPLFLCSGTDLWGSGILREPLVQGQLDPVELRYPLERSGVEKIKAADPPAPKSVQRFQSLTELAGTVYERILEPTVPLCTGRNAPEPVQRAREGVEEALVETGRMEEALPESRELLDNLKAALLEFRDALNGLPDGGRAFSDAYSRVRDLYNHLLSARRQP